jgi:hypothetical protein
MANAEYRPAPSARIVITVDGALNRDSLAAIATEIETGFQFVVAIETRPDDAPDDYRHGQDAVDAAVEQAFERYTVERVLVDPQFIESLLATWQARWGDEVVIAFYTNTQVAKIAHAVRRYSEAIARGELSHDGDPTLTAHVRQAVRRPVHVRDDDDRPLWVIRKDSPNSPRKIDGAMAAVMGWDARYEAIREPPEPEHTFENVWVRETPGHHELIEIGGMRVPDDERYHDKPPADLTRRKDLSRRYR